MNRKDAKANKALLESLPLPDGTTDAEWEQNARAMIQAFGGDHVKLVKLLILANEYRDEQVAYLQDGLQKLSDAYPGLIKISHAHVGAGQPRAN